MDLSNIIKLLERRSLGEHHNNNFYNSQNQFSCAQETINASTFSATPVRPSQGIAQHPSHIAPIIYVNQLKLNLTETKIHYITPEQFKTKNNF